MEADAREVLREERRRYVVLDVSLEAHMLISFLSLVNELVVVRISRKKRKNWNDSSG